MITNHDPELVRRLKTERTMVRVRWAGVAFGLLQVLTYYLPYPPGIRSLALGLVGALAAGNIVMWYLMRKTTTVAAARRVSIAGLILDIAIILGFAFVYAFDQETAIWALIYILPLEGAIRFQTRGAMLAMAAAALAYLVREVYGTNVYGNDFLLTSISFRMGIGFIIAAVSGATCSALVRERGEVEKSYEAAREAADHLREVDEMKNAFLAAVSHDLRTPLTAILGFAKTLERALPRISQDEAQAIAGRIAANAERLNRMLEDLLDVDRLSRGLLEPDRAPTDLAALAGKVINGVDLKGRTVVTDFSDVVASVDGQQIERVLENLLANALKHTPNGVSIWLGVRHKKEGVLLSVEDDGPGVPQDEKEVIFEPFRQGKGPHATGSGIGLSLVFKFAQLHGGRAWVEDRPGGGARFCVLLPDEEHSEARPSTSPAEALEKLNV